MAIVHAPRESDSAVRFGETLRPGGRVVLSYKVNPTDFHEMLGGRPIKKLYWVMVATDGGLQQLDLRSVAVLHDVAGRATAQPLPGYWQSAGA